MLRKIAFLLLISVAAVVAQDEPLGKVQRLADTAQGGDCARYCLEASRQMADMSDRLYTDGKVDEAEQMMRQAGDYAERGTHCSIQSRKHEKDTEIALRKLSMRMSAISRTLASEDRPVVDAEMQRVDKLRFSVLSAMFGPVNINSLKERH